MNIVVLAGGLSDERDVSLSSGSQIANALISKGHRVLLIDIYIGVANKENFDDAYSKLSTSKYEYAVPKEEPDLELLRREQNYQKSLIGPNVISICQSADFCFLACMVELARMASYRLYLIFMEFLIVEAAMQEACLQWIKHSPNN